jgi:Tol biopolymer transport system component
LLIAVLLGLSFLLYKRLSSNTSRTLSFEQMRMTRLTTTGDIFGAVITPEGKYIAYIVNDKNRRPSLWVRQVNTGSAIQIVPTGDLAYWGLSISRDGDYLYYVLGARSTVSQGALYQVPVLGGPSKKILEGIISSPAVSPDNRRLAFVRYVANPRAYQLIATNTDGSDERLIAATNSAAAFQNPRWSPDGKLILYTAANADSEGVYYYLATMPVDGGPEQPFTSKSRHRIRDAIWMPDGKSVIMLATGENISQTQLWRVAYPSGDVHRMTNDLKQYLSASLTADGSAMVALQIARQTNLWVAPGGDLSRARQLTSGSGEYDHATWTPDGRIVYDTFENGKRQLFTLTTDESNNAYPSVTPDGRYIVFASDRTGRQQIWRMDMDGTRLKQLTDGNTSSDFPQCTPDSKWVLCTNLSVSKGFLSKVAIDGGEPVPLTDAIVHSCAVSPDSKLLAYERLDEATKRWRIQVVSLNGGEPVATFDLQSDWMMQWTRDGSGILYDKLESGGSEIWMQPLAGGPPRQLTNLKTDTIYWFDYARDGQLLCVRGADVTDIVLFNNFK